jgi:acyl-CoA synthetase (AMP-forming)/AMP-acid ligase II
MDWWQSGDLIEVDPTHGPKILGRKDNQFKYKDFKVVPENFELIAKELDTVNEAMLTLEYHLVMYYEGEATPSDVEDIIKDKYFLEVSCFYFELNVLLRNLIAY